MINEIMREKLTKIKVCQNLMNNRNIMFGLSPPYGKRRKIEELHMICFDECWIFFSLTSFYIRKITYLAKIARALLSNKIDFFAFLQKVNDSIATKLCVNFINNCAIF